MKKLITAAAAVLLAAVILTGCTLSVNLGGKPSASPSAATKELTRGIIEDNVYTSEYSGLKFTAPEGWVYASDEDIAEVAGIGADMLSEAGMPVTEEMMKQKDIYDMMAQDPATGSSVMVMYENLAMSLGGTKVKEERYVDQSATMMSQTDAVKYEFGDITKESLGSEEYTLLPASMPDYNGVQYYYVRKIDKYMLGIIITVFGGNDVSDIKADFS